MVLFVTAVALAALLIPRTIKSDITEATQILTPLSSLSETPTIEEVKLAVDNIAYKYGLNKEQLYNTILCESSFRYNAVGDNGLAVGLAQFHRPTFDSFSKEMGLVLDYYSPKDQLELMGWAWSRGYQYHWSCFNNLYK